MAYPAAAYSRQPKIAAALAQGNDGFGPFDTPSPRVLALAVSNPGYRNDEGEATTAASLRPVNAAPAAEPRPRTDAAMEADVLTGRTAEGDADAKARRQQRLAATLGSGPAAPG